ncbi:TPA: branched-chain amino acid ABC transporter permease, partial [Pseudomonas aeruginosa]|nr:branched-chain amino acid ABC transporter permease [Pseudomonas aeruginosa]HEJ3999808.1 branched-chain amino acid ABC transporter permease [Pseudomonas aeruginosa]
SHWQWSSALVLAGLAGMAAGFICNKLYREAPWSGQ